MYLYFAYGSVLSRRHLGEWAAEHGVDARLFARGVGYIAAAVGHKPVPVSEMVRTRARGFDRHEPHGVFHGFQITSHKSEPVRRVRNLLSKDDCRFKLANEMKERGP